MPLELENIQGGYNLSAINNNFQKIEDTWDEKLDRLESSQGNQLEQELDMNSNHIINHPEPRTDTDLIRLKDLEAFTIEGGVEGVTPKVQPRQTGDGVSTSFEAPHSSPADPKSFIVNIDGLTKRPWTDYVTPSAGVIEFIVAPALDANIDITYYEPSTIEAVLDEAGKEAITEAQEDIVEGTIYKGTNGIYVQNGDTIPTGTTYIRILISGEPILIRAWDSLVLPAEVTTIPTSDNGFNGYTVQTDQGSFEFVEETVHSLRKNVDPLGWGADPTGVADSIEHLEKAKDYGDIVRKEVQLPCNSEFSVSRTWYVGTITGTGLTGCGEDSSVIKAALSFDYVSNPEVVCAGNKASSNVVRNIHLSKFGIDCNALTGVEGLGHYGLRDGSTVEKIYITNFVGTAYRTGQAGNTGGAATGKMNQGVYINSVHCISFNDLLGTVWALDGIFESTVESCKALGSSVAENKCNGFEVAINSECRGLRLVGCAAGNLNNTQSFSNYGIKYGSWARNCWDINTTFEFITGGAACYDGGNASGTLLPFNCRTESPRVYNIASAGTLEPVATFGDANTCYFGSLSYYNTTKVWAKFKTPVFSQQNNVFECTGSVNPEDLEGNQVVFEAGSSASNRAVGWSNGSTSRINFVVTPAVSGEYESNGYNTSHDQFWSTLQLGEPNKLRFRDNVGNTIMSLDATNNTVTLNDPNIYIPNLRTTESGTPGYLWNNAGNVEIS